MEVTEGIGATEVNGAEIEAAIAAAGVAGDGDGAAEATDVLTDKEGGICLPPNTRHRRVIGNRAATIVAGRVTGDR